MGDLKVVSPSEVVHVSDAKASQYGMHESFFNQGRNAPDLSVDELDRKDSCNCWDEDEFRKIKQIFKECVVRIMGCDRRGDKAIKAGQLAKILTDHKWINQMPRIRAQQKAYREEQLRKLKSKKTCQCRYTGWARQCGTSDKGYCGMGDRLKKYKLKTGEILWICARCAGFNMSGDTCYRDQMT